LGTRTGRPSDAPIPLCLCKTPASTIPSSRSIAGGNGSRLFVALAMDWFNAIARIGKNADQPNGHGWQRWRNAGSLPPFCYRSAPACAYLTTACGNRGGAALASEKVSQSSFQYFATAVEANHSSLLRKEHAHDTDLPFLQIRLRCELATDDGPRSSSAANQSESNSGVP
jgi:hypothetical protein